MEASQIIIRFNGEEREVRSSTLAELLEEFQLSNKRVAVELNQQIIRRESYPQTPLTAGDRVEVVQFVGGG